MAMESPTFDKLKEEGNNSIKEKRYQDAVECYSAALKLKPREHTVFSNRSLAYLRIGKLEESLSDAQMCVEVCPCTICLRLYAKGSDAEHAPAV